MIILANSSSVRSASQFITVIIIFVIVLMLTYFTTKYVGSYQKMQGVNKNFETIETFRVTNNKYLQLVRMGDKYIVIAIGKDEITKIAELDESSIVVPPTSNGAAMDTFASIISKAKNRANKGENNE